MRYILNNEGYIYDVSFGGIIECSLGTCTEYKGTIPNGYSTIEDWHAGEIDRLNAWKIVDGNLVFDANRDYKLKIKFDQENNENSHVTRKEMGMASTEETSPYTDLFPSHETARGYIVSVNEEFNKVGNLPTEEVNLTLDKEQDLDLIELEFIGNNFLPNNATSSVNNGITYTQNKDKTINANGIATDKSTLNLAGTDTSVRNILTFKANEMYLLSGLEGASIELYHYDGTDRTLIGTYSDGAISFDKDINITQVVLVVDKGTSINTTIKPMLKLIGLDYPLLPMTKYKGNLYDEKNYPITLNKALNYETGSVYSISSGNYYATEDYVPIDGAIISQITFSKNVTVAFYNSSMNVISGGVGKQTYDVPSNASYLRFDIHKDYINNIQIEEGSVATEYKEYNGRDGEYYVDGVSTQETKSHDKNKINPYNKHSASARYDYVNDTYKLTGLGDIYLMCTVVVGKTYTLSYKNNNGFASIRATNYNNGGTWIEYGRSTTTDGKVTFTATTDTVIVQFVGGTANSSTVQKVQLEEGSSATTYEPYGTSPSPSYPSEIINLYPAGTYNALVENVLYEITIDEDLRSTPDGTADRLWLIPLGVIDIERKVGRVVLDGSENWSKMTTSGYYRYGINDDAIKNDTSLANVVINYCNRFRGITFNNRGGDTANTIYTICNGLAGNSAFYINTLNHTSLDDFKTWLSTHNTEVYYPLATSTTNTYGLAFNSYEYEEYKNNTTLIDLAGNDFAAGNNISIKDNQIVLIKGNEEIYLGDTVMPRTYTPYTHAYCHQPLHIDFRYKDPRNIDITKITLEGLLSITNIETEYNFTNDDLTKIQNYIMKTGDLTDEEIELYDVNGDGVIKSTDYVTIRNMINGIFSNIIRGTLEINSTQSKRTIVLRDENGKIQTSLGLNGVCTPSLSVNGASVEENIGYSETPTTTFLNGKRVYKRLYTGQMPSTTGSMATLFTYDFEPTQIWVDESMSFIDNGTVIHSIDYYNTTNDYLRIMINKNTKNVQTKAGADLSTYTYNVVLAYTKD